MGTVVFDLEGFFDIMRVDHIQRDEISLWIDRLKIAHAKRPVLDRHERTPYTMN